MSTYESAILPASQEWYAPREKGGYSCMSQECRRWSWCSGYRHRQKTCRRSPRMARTRQRKGTRLAGALELQRMCERFVIWISTVHLTSAKLRTYVGLCLWTTS